MNSGNGDKWWRGLSLIVIVGLSLWLLMTLWPDIVDAFKHGPGLTIFLVCVAGVLLGFLLRKIAGAGDRGKREKEDQKKTSDPNTPTNPPSTTVQKEEPEEVSDPNDSEENSPPEDDASNNDKSKLALVALGEEYPEAIPVLQVFLIALAVAGFLMGAASVISFPETKAAAFRLSCLWAFAFLSCGFLLGFLFGLPPASVKQGQPNGQAAQGNLPETGLEAIQDWLTKIILGIGLVESKTLIQGFKSTSKLVAKGLCDNNTPTQNAVSFASSIILLFSILGFLAGFLLTKLFIQGALAKSARRFLLKDFGVVKLQSPEAGVPPETRVALTDSARSVAPLPYAAPPATGVSSPPLGQTSAFKTEAERIRAFWRPGGKVDLDNEQRLVDWMKRNCPGYLISDLIYLEGLQPLRLLAVGELNIP